MNIAVVGLGFMGSTHIKALKNIEDARLVAVLSSDPGKLAGDLSAIKGNLGGPGEKFDFSDVNKYSRFEDLLSDPAVEAVDLCLPTYMHASHTIAALQAGKHVLVEKPMALNPAECDAMTGAARETGRVLMVGQVLRFVPAYVVLRNMLRKGDVGQVRAATFRRRCAAPGWSKWLSQRDRGGGGVFDLLIHDIDYCLNLFGVPDHISATGAEDMDKGIDILNANLHYPHTTVQVTGGRHHPKSFPFSDEYTVVTDGGTIEYNYVDRPPALYGADGEKQDVTLPMVSGFEGELRYFLECCRTGSAPKLCPPEESAAAVKLLLALIDARKDQGAKISCNL